MPDQPENTAPQAKPKAPLWRRVAAWTVIGLLYLAFLGMAWWAVTLVRSAFSANISFDDRLFPLLGAAALLVLPVRVAWIYLRTKWTTDHWLMTKQESAQKLAQCSVRRNPAMQTPPWSWIQFAVKWANYSAMEASCPLWQRTTGWTLLVGFGALMLALTGLAVVFIGAGFATNWTLGILMIGIGALLLMIPSLVVWACIRRIRATGNLRTSQVELRQMDAQRTEWRVRESQKPLRSKIISTVITVVVLDAWWIRDTLHHSQHARESWLVPGFWTLFAVYAIWVQFREPKNFLSQSSDPPAVT